MNPPDPKRKPKWGDRDWYGEQDENGVDLSLIRENLKLSVEQRLRKAEMGRLNAVRMRRYERIDRPQPVRTDRGDPDPARG